MCAKYFAFIISKSKSQISIRIKNRTAIKNPNQFTEYSLLFFCLTETIETEINDH